MKWLLILLLCAVFGAVAAQQPADPQPAPSSEPASEEPASEESSDDDPAEDADSTADAVEESVPPAPPEDALGDEEFEPGEEISEDYPVPLPADI